MPNPNGAPGNLVAAHPGNANRLRHGVYAQRAAPLDDEGREIVDRLMAEPWAHELDAIGAAEIARLVRLLDRIDDELAVGKLTASKRTLLDHRQRLSGRLQSWLREYGLTPAQRAELTARLRPAGDSVQEIMARKLAALRTEEDS